jgi:cysteine synthase B
MELFGAEIVYSDGSQGTNGSIKLAQQLAEDPRYFMPYQYGNPANPLAHYETTAVEILRDCPEVDVLVAGLGTGGTLMGCARRLKEHDPRIRVVAVEPHPGDLVQGLRSLDEGFIPPILDASLLDSKIIVDSRCAFAATKDLTTKEGIFAGVSSGAVIHCAIRVAHRMERGTIVCVLCDGGWKYVSLGVWFKEFPPVGENIQSHVWW